VLVEVLVLGRQNALMTSFGTAGSANKTAFLGIFAEQRTVRRMDAGHDRRLIILKLRVVGQSLRNARSVRGRGDAHQKHHGSGGEQETQERTSKRIIKYPFQPCAVTTGTFPCVSPAEQSPFRASYAVGADFDRFRDLADVFYRTGAVAKLGLRPRGFPFSVRRPAVARRLAKKASIACAIEPTVRNASFRDQMFESPLFET